MARNTPRYIVAALGRFFRSKGYRAWRAEVASGRSFAPEKTVLTIALVRRACRGLIG
ncbi:MAG: hypothetical protein QGG14_09580 [Planctomycetota bacterium]|jgi:hypothetical protein|nr:hypothetical protein [Planctomycetota bacterium]